MVHQFKSTEIFEIIIYFASVVTFVLSLVKSNKNVDTLSSLNESIIFDINNNISNLEIIDNQINCNNTSSFIKINYILL